MTLKQPQVGMGIECQGEMWTVRQVIWLADETHGSWTALDVRVEKED